MHVHSLLTVFLGSDHGESDEAADPFYLHNLSADEALTIIKAVEKNMANISKEPPVLPCAGQVFIFKLGSDESKWDKMKRKYR